MAKPTDSEQAELCVHIFSVSAGMVGVCLTVIGLIAIMQQLQKVDTLADNLLAIDAFGYLAACLLAYLALRSRGSRRRRLEAWADTIFLVALGIMVCASVIVAYQLI